VTSSRGEVRRDELRVDLPKPAVRLLVQLLLPLLATKKKGRRRWPRSGLARREGEGVELLATVL